ncbi:MAG: chemotaxis protein CheW [Desulfobacteraceae bacterium]|jgi:two-component system chemotaxis sensor kinase CheA
MSIQDDETLQMYLEESLDHLADIENDFLAIEEDGADINEDLVNKVYRAAHSIKGGAGFMGLTNIKDLTHEMENILGKIRSREMIPTPNIVNVLLKASDALKDLMGDILNSNEMDISDHVSSLQAVLGGCDEPLPEAAVKETVPSAAPSPPETAVEAPAAQAVDGKLSLAMPDGSLVITVPVDKIQPIFEQSKCVYLVKIDVAKDIQAKGKTCQGVLEEMEQTGTIVGANFNLVFSNQVDKHWTPDVPIMLFLFGSILKPDDINVLFEIDVNQILQLREDHLLYNLNGEPAGQDTDISETATADPQKPLVSSNSVDETPSQPVGKPEVNAEISEPVDLPTEELAEEPLPDPVPLPSTTSGISTKKQAKVEHETSLRVHVSLLDQLMTLAGELVLSRNQLLQSITSGDHRGSEIAGQRIDLITSELQEAIMLTRMQSIGNVFNKFPRVVRDLSQSLGKQIELTLEGKDVELDKTIIEAIGDPLTHLVRNSVDHGIELPSVRRQAGKNPTGQIFLKAYHEAGQVNIEITDDGKGLDGGKLAAKAIQKGLITEDQAKLMSAREKTNLIFLPGFSTAEKVTDVSGRGVGMDVVKTNLDQLGGIIDIDSEPGKGTTIRIKLPLTLAIIPCQIVLTGGERYAIPQVNLEELLRIPADQVRNRIERVGDADVVRLRGNLLPLIRLAEVIGVEPQYTDPESGETKPDRRKSLADRRSKKSPLFDEDADTAGEKTSSTQEHHQSRQVHERRFHAESALNIVVVSTGAMKYGLVVDELNDSEEIVVKPLGRDLKKCKGYAGATIMGDGRVALILDVSNIAQMAGLTSIEGSTRAAEVARAEQEAVRAGQDKQALLIFRSAEDEQFAAPLNLVERIEKIKSTDVENLGGKRVIKYRGGSLPLFSIDEVAMVKPLADTENMLVIVFNVASREVGLLAMGPVDAQEVNLDIDGVTLRQPGIMGSAIINDNTTLLVDIYEIVKALNPQWFEEPKLPESMEGEAPTILFAEDSSFFRNQVKSSMEKEGFNVLEAEDGLIAWDLLVENADLVSLVVTDIEMPNMDGFALTEKIKGSSAFAHLPVIALTTLAGEEDIARGKQVGIDDYQIKLDREKLMNSIHGFFKAMAA